LLKRAARYSLPFSILFYDLDHFKQVNDQYGHPAGDEVLQQITTRVQTLLRNTDTLARYGGEEFLRVDSGNQREVLRNLAERIRKEVEKLEITLKTGDILKLTVSIGVAGYQETDTVSSLIERADQAVYRAKELGRNRVFRC
jgi:diguanylate cyclase (GGDEF)-like protein